MRKHRGCVRACVCVAYYENVGQEDTDDARLPFGVLESRIKLRKKIQYIY